MNKEERIHSLLYSCDSRDELCERVVALEELVRELWCDLDAATQYDAGGGRGIVYEFADRMRELGVEA